MKKECSIVRDVLPLYLEKMVSEDTTVFVEEHLKSCSDCAVELEQLKSGGQMDLSETPQREHDAEVIATVKKKISKRIVKIVAGVCLIFAVLLIVILLYTSITYPVKNGDILLSTKTDGEYSYIIMDIGAGKSVSFESKSEEVLNSKNEVCVQKIILSNLKYHKDFTQDAGFMSWGCPKDNYLEVVVELEDDTLQISNQE